MNVYVSYVLEHKKKQKKIFVCMSACTYVCMYVHGFLAVDTITFERVSGSKQNFVGFFDE